MEVPKAWVKPDFRAWLSDKCTQWPGIIKLLVTLCPKLRSLACRAGRQLDNNSSKEAGLATSFPKAGERSKVAFGEKKSLAYEKWASPFLSLISCRNSQYIASDREG
jgi:hypothetical protein